MRGIAPGRQTSLSAVTGLLASFTRQGRELLQRHVPLVLYGRGSATRRSTAATAQALAEALLSVRGEASGMAIARDLLALYREASEGDRLAFFHMLAESFDPDPDALRAAWAKYVAEGRPALPALSQAAEAPRQELFRRLNLAPGGTSAIVQMRSDLLGWLKSAEGQLDAVEADLAHLLQSWFNRGFLTMQAISWASPGHLLERVIRYEAVHHIRDWDDLRRRLDPSDRRCFGFFHPAMPDEPLIFVEVGLTQGMPSSIQSILAEDRCILSADHADTAVFYSISNSQMGLRGISFGHFLIKQVADDLRRELPNLQRFVTLSPIPGLMAWLTRTGDPSLAWLKAENWWTGADAEKIRELLLRRALEYLTQAKTEAGRPLDPVARFHLGNGSRLERLNWLGDLSANGLRQSAGLMVNYFYDLTCIEENHEGYAERGAIVTGEPFRQMAEALEKSARSRAKVAVEGAG